MSMKQLMDRLKMNYREGGASNIYKKIYAKVMHKFYKNKNIIWFYDLADADDYVTPHGVSVNSYRSASEIPADAYESLKKHRPATVLDRQLQERFGNGCILWTLAKEGVVRCFMWTGVGYAPKGFYFPLSLKDIYVFDAETFKEYRGRGFMPVLSRSVLNDLKNKKYIRVFHVTQTWNRAINRAAKKDYYKKLAIARKYNFFGRTLTIWKSCDEDAREREVLGAR